MSNPPAPLGVGTPQGVMSPTGPSMAPQPYQADPRLQRDSEIMQMFSNINRLGGGPGLTDPFQAQIKANQDLAKERMSNYRRNQNQLAPSSVREYEYLKTLSPEDQELYFRNKRGDQRTSGQKNTAFLNEATPEERTAFFQQMGYQTKTLPDGSVVAVSPDGQTTEILWDANSMQQGAANLAGGIANAQGGAKVDWEVVSNVETNLSTLADEWEASNAGVQRGREALELLSSGEIEPGLVAGTVLDYLGIGSSKLAYYQNLSQQQLFEELGSATLTPVSDADIRALAKLFTSASQSPEVARGNLEAFLTRKEREQERKSGRMRREINRIGDEGYRSGLLETYQPFVDFKAINKWEDVPGG